MRRTLKWCGVSMAALIGLLVAAYALRGVYLAPWVEQVLIAAAEQHSGIGLSVGAVGGSYLSDFTLSDVRTLRPAVRGPVRSVEIRSLRASYNLFALISGIDPFLGSVTLQLSGARVEVDLGEDAEGGAGRPVDAGGGTPAALPGILPAVRVRDTSFQLRGPDYRADLSGVALDVERRRGGFTPIRATVSELKWDHPALQPGAVTVDARLEYSPGVLRLRTLDIDGRSLAEDVQLGLADLPRSMPVGGRLRTLGGQAEFRVRVGQSGMDGELRLDGLDLEKAAQLLRSPPPSLGGQLFAVASAQVAWEHPDLLTAALTARIEGGRLAGEVAEYLDVKAGTAGGRLKVESLLARLGANEAELRGLDVPLAPALAGELAVLLAAGKADLRADLRDLPALLTLVGVPATGLPIPDHRVKLTARVLDGHLEINELVATTPGNTAEVRDLRASLKALAGGEVESLARSSSGWFRADLRDIPALAALAGVGTDRLIPAHHLLFAGRAARGRVEITEGRLTAGTAEVLLDGARFGLPEASGLDWANASMEAELAVDVPDLAAILSLIGEAEVSGELRGRLSLTGTVGAPRGSLLFTGRGLAWRDLVLGRASVEVAVVPERIELLSLVMERGGDRLVGRGVYHLEAKGLAGVVLDLSTENVGFYTRILAPDLDLSGGRVTARLEAVGPLRAPTGSLSLRGSAVSVSGVAVEQFDLEARVKGGSVSFDPIALRTGVGALTASGTATLPGPDGSFSIALESLRLTRGAVELNLQAPSQIAGRTTGSVAVDALVMAGAVGTLRLGGRFEPEGESDLTLQVSDLTGSGWLEALVGDRASFRGAHLNAHLAGPLKTPRATLRGELAELRFQGMPFPSGVTLDLGYSPEGIQVSALEWSTSGGEGISARGRLPLDPLSPSLLLPGPLEFNARLDVPDLSRLGAHVFPELAGTGMGTAALVLGGTWAAPAGSLELHAEGLDLAALPEPRPPGPFSVECLAALAEGRATVEALKLRSPTLELEFSGEWTGMPPTAALLSGKPGDLGTVAGQGRLRIHSLDWVTQGVGALRRLRGTAWGDLEVKGPVEGPSLNGELHLEDGEVRINGPTPTIQGLNLHLAANAGEVLVKELRGELGGAPFTASGTLTRVAGAEGESWQAGLHLAGRDLLLFRDDGFKVRADTELAVAGPLASLEVRGEIGLTDSRYVRNINLLSVVQGSSAPATGGGAAEFSFPTPPLRDARLDIVITSRQPFQVRNNLVALQLRPELRLSGTGALPVLVGDIYLDPGRVELPAGRLRVESGTVQFLESSPGRPRLDVLGASRLLGYDVSLQVTGPYNEPVVTLSSVPPLPNDELLLLVLAGTPPRSELEESAAQKSGLQIATFLGKSMLGSLWGNESTESSESVLDRFDVEIGRGVSQKGEETIEASFRLGDDVLREGDQVYLRGERDIYDAYNSGVRFVFRFP